MKKRTQVDRLVSYLKRHRKGISTREAMNTLGICALHSRINDAWRQQAILIGKYKDGDIYRYRIV